MNNKERTTTKYQRFYQIGDQLKADIDVYITCESIDEHATPSIAECRHAILQLKNKGNGYVIYDRLLCRIVNGVYYHMPIEEILELGDTLQLMAWHAHQCFRM